MAQRTNPVFDLEPQRDLGTDYILIAAGVGAALVAEFFEWARARGAQRAAVTAYAANDRAIAFYARNGFQPRSLHLEVGL